MSDRESRWAEGTPCFAGWSSRVVINFTSENIYVLSGPQNKGSWETLHWLTSLCTLRNFHCRSKVMLISQWTETERKTVNTRSKNISNALPLMRFSLLLTPVVWLHRWQIRRLRKPLQLQSDCCFLFLHIWFQQERKNKHTRCIFI